MGEDNKDKHGLRLSRSSLISISGFNRTYEAVLVQLVPQTQLYPRPPTKIHQNTIFVTQMSTSSRTVDTSTSNFAAIFDAASREYKSLTKKDLATHPLAAAIEGYNSPDAILNVFRKQASAFDKFRKAGDKLMEWLTPIVNILFTFSETLGEGVGLVSLHSVEYIKVL